MTARLLLAVCALLLVVAALPALAAPWSSVPLDRWAEMPLVDSTTEAMPPGGPPPIPVDHRAAVPVPQPPYGRWSEDGEALLATGRTNCWSTMLRPGTLEADVSIKLRFTVERSCGAQRQLPGGCVRWGFHWGENLPGWDVGVVFGYRDPPVVPRRFML